MKKLFLMSIFGLSMTVAAGGKAGSIVSFSAPVYANDNSSHNGSNDDEIHSDEISNDNIIAFSCPEGVSTCYRADGSEYVDVNSLSASAAGQESGNDHDDNEHGDESYEADDGNVNLVKSVRPRDFRSL